MKILFDHCVPKRLAASLSPHVVTTTRQMGWEELKNGALLSAAAVEFDVFLTVDRRMRYEQNLATLPIAVVVLLANSNRLADLLPLVPLVHTSLAKLEPRRLVEVSTPTS